MEVGAHLPLVELDGGRRTLAELRGYADRAARLGYRFLCGNDHLQLSRPWLDGLTALAATIDAAGDMTLATTVCLPVIRGPVQTAKALAALDVLSEGRLIAGVGPGSSARDYAAAGVPFDERWARFDEAAQALRSLLSRDAPPFTGRYYATDGLRLEPHPVDPRGPPIWLASWASPAGLRRAARLGDGWLASGYNATPATFSRSLGELGAALREAGKAPEAFPNAVATMWLFVTERRGEADRILDDVLAPLVNRPAAALRELALPIGSREQCAERLAAWHGAGAQRVFVWPLGDEARQLERFRDVLAASGLDT